MEHEVPTPTTLQPLRPADTGGGSFALIGKILLALGTIGAIGVFVLYRLMLPPEDFVSPTFVEVPSGYSTKEIASLLSLRHIIRSEALFAFLVSYDEKEGSIPAGDYLFEEPASLFDVVRRMTGGVHGIATHRVTFPEGITVKGMAQILAEALPDFDASAFIREGEGKEGYLFPDTYFFYSTATSGPIIAALEANFSEKTIALRASSSALKLDWASVVNLASIVEKEAATPRDRRIIAGILLERLRIGMRLQVDAPFLYTLGKTSSQLSMNDLSSDSPYNTYRVGGLPPTPIGNPGADAITSVIFPEKTTYLFYLSAQDGTMYYAKTFAEHKANKAKYLK